MLISSLAFIVKRQNKRQNNMEFLLHKDKENGNPTHNPHSGTFGCPTHGRLLRSQKSLHFAYAPKPTRLP